MRRLDHANGFLWRIVLKKSAAQLFETAREDRRARTRACSGRHWGGERDQLGELSEILDHCSEEELVLGPIWRPVSRQTWVMSTPQAPRNKPRGPRIHRQARVQDADEKTAGVSDCGPMGDHPAAGGRRHPQVRSAWMGQGPRVAQAKCRDDHDATAHIMKAPGEIAWLHRTLATSRCGFAPLSFSKALASDQGVMPRSISQPRFDHPVHDDRR